MNSEKVKNLKLNDIPEILTEWRYTRPFRRFRDITYALRNMIFRGHNNVRLRKFAGKDWVETDERLFEATFELLREFVEEQKAWMECISSSDTYGWRVRFKLRYLPNRFRQQLSRELGLRYLDWEITECHDVPQQAASAKKIKELYLWYMDEYGKVDPWNAVPEPPGKLFNFGPVCEDGCRQLLPNEGPGWDEYHAATERASVETDRLYNEATEKAIEVIQLRANLWT
jgi:hypothetical protein